MTSNITLIAGLLAIALFVSAIGTFTAVTKSTGLLTQGTANATVLEATDITLVVSSIDFGNIGIGEIKSTESGYAPFNVQNDGSVDINVTVNSTTLWATNPSTTAYYRVKCRISQVACGIGSQETYIDMPVNTAATKVIGTLPFLDSGDDNFVDVQITVPLKESVGAKSATVTFIATKA